MDCLTALAQAMLCGSQSVKRQSRLCLHQCRFNYSIVKQDRDAALLPLAWNNVGKVYNNHPMFREMQVELLILIAITIEVVICV